MESVDYSRHSIVKAILRDFFSLCGQNDRVVLSGGALLGSFRDGKVAGRPSDVDVIYIVRVGNDHYPLVETLLNNGYELSFNGSGGIKDLITVSKFGMDLDLTIYRSFKLFSQEYFMRLNSLELWGQRIFLPTTNVVLYGENYPAPTQSKVLLERWYGKTWHIPSHFKNTSSEVRNRDALQRRYINRNLYFWLAVFLRKVVLNSRLIANCVFGKNCHFETSGEVPK